MSSIPWAVVPIAALNSAVTRDFWQGLCLDDGSQTGKERRPGGRVGRRSVAAVANSTPIRSRPTLDPVRHIVDDLTIMSGCRSFDDHYAG
jgi:hypothetical protein